MRVPQFLSTLPRPRLLLAVVNYSWPPLETKVNHFTLQDRNDFEVNMLRRRHIFSFYLLTF